jgi:hypothetical protein
MQECRSFACFYLLCMLPFPVLQTLYMQEYSTHAAVGLDLPSSAAAASAFSVRQLKALLAWLGVDCAAAVEKSLLSPPPTKSVTWWGHWRHTWGSTKQCWVLDAGVVSDDSLQTTRLLVGE